MKLLQLFFELANLIKFYRFVLVKFANDTIVQPVDSEWFQFYTPNQDKIIQPLAESNAAVSNAFKLKKNL